MRDIAELGKMAYEAYAEYTGGKTFDGRDMPTWDGLGDRIRGAWTAAASRVASQVTADLDT